MNQVNPFPMILVAQDGSPAARTAASVAIQIAQSQNLGIRGLYVVDAALVMEPYTDYQAELGSAELPTSRVDLVAQFEGQGEVALEWLEANCRAAGVPVTAQMEFGGVPELVLQQVAQAPLLALGRRGHGHATDPNHLGRNFQAIAHQTHHPMLVGGDEQRRLQCLLLAYHGKAHAQNALTWAARLQHSLSAKVFALAVQEGDDPEASRRLLEEVQAGLDQSGLTDYHLLTRSGQPAAEIVATATENDVDLIILGGYSHRALVEWLIGSTVDRVLRSTPLPVFIA
jgi:nucleotide-binding universal stress UspA family protein